VLKMLLGAINDTFDKIGDKHDSGDYGVGSSSNRQSVQSNYKDEYA
jgi:hypothetical protein